MTKTIQVPCGECNSLFLKLIREYKRTLNHYCSQSCAGKASNRKAGDRARRKLKDSNAKCLTCKEPIPFKKGSSLNTSLSRKFCSNKCKYESDIFQKPIEEFKWFGRTKGELFKARKSWQSARTEIRKISQKVFDREGLDKKCQKCGYDKHFEVAHIKAVSDFGDEEKIGDICNKNNLIAFCPTHHWEFDNGILSISECEKSGISAAS